MTVISNASMALAVPAGQQADYVNPPTIAPAIVGGLTICLLVSTLSAVVRCYAQWSLFRKLVWPDFWMLLGWTSQVAFAASLYACLPYGAGRHLWDVTMSNYHEIKFLLFIDFVLYDTAVLGPKISILLQLRTIFAPHRGRNSVCARVFFWTSTLLMAINLIFYVSLSFALIFQCRPISKGWNASIPGTCLYQDSLLESSGPFNIISDFLMILLPLPVVWQLQLPVRTRLGIVSVFAIGLYGCVCSAVRLFYSNRLDESGDATYLIFQNQLWANAEITTAMLIANMIIVPGFLRYKRASSYRYDNYHHINQSCIVLQPKEPAQYPVSPQLEYPCDSHITLTNDSFSTRCKDRRRYGGRQNIDDSQTEGIVRTVEIATTNEMVDLPARVRVNSRRMDILMDHASDPNSRYNLQV